MHELNIVIEIELPGLEGFLFVLDLILVFGSLFLLDVDVHLRQVDFLLLLQELMH